jgi:peptide/nickel transport system ATP-binding protein
LFEVKNLQKSFGAASSMKWLRKLRGLALPEAHQAVAGVSFALARGECLGIVGESGSGKTTLIRMLAGLSRPTSGEIRYQGQPITSFTDRRARRALQMVFQDPTESLNPCMTVFDIIADPLRNLVALDGAQDLTRRVRTLADQVQLPSELLGRYPHQLSGGQKARVGIARALAPEPEILLLDEPTTALDVSVQAKILVLLADLRSQLQMSFVFVSHDLSVVRLLCDRVMIMRHGQVVESGSVLDIFSAGQHDYTRALLAAVPALARP